jgi:hypothetical protein
MKAQDGQPLLPGGQLQIRIHVMLRELVEEESNHEQTISRGASESGILPAAHNHGCSTLSRNCH